MKLFYLSLHLLLRDWRAGEWRILLVALVLAISSLATTGMYTDRVRQALQQQATSLIGGDLRINSTRPLPDSYRIQAQKSGLNTVLSRSFLSMTRHQQQALLCEIQAVESGYPLRGHLEIDDGKQHMAAGIPAKGTVWVDSRLMRRLQLKLGEPLSIGKLQFVVAAQIVRDIDSSVSFYSFAPRLLLNSDDLEATGLLQTGSRIQYRQMFAGNGSQIAAFRNKLQLSKHEKLEDGRDARPEIRTGLERAEHFLGLAALTAAILAGAAIALAARRFVLRHLENCAVMRCLGAQQQQVLRLFLYQFLLLGLMAALLGCVAGYLTQALLVDMIEALRDAQLPPPGILPALKAAASGFALLLGFAFLPLLQLQKVSPLCVLRQESGVANTQPWLAYGLSILVLAGLFLWQAGSLKLGLTMLCGLVAGLLCFGLLVRIVLKLARKAAFTGQLMQHAFNNLTRHRHDSALQVVALALGGMALLLLTLIRGDLLQSWQSKLAADTPNRFIVNIQPEQLQAVRQFFTRQALAQPQLLPMVKGRLLTINSKPVNGDNYADPRARELVERDFNLGWSEELPVWNELVSGSWWPGLSAVCTGSCREQLSVEEVIANRLNIHLGDLLSFEAAGTRFSARVSNLRHVQWDSMRVNFFVIGTPELLQGLAASYISSFYLPGDKLAAGDQLVNEFPNLLVIDTGAIILQLRSIMTQIAQTVGVIFLYTLACGFAVLYAAMLATQDERKKEAAILRTLGASSRYLRQLHLIEFATLGLLSGLFAAAGATLSGWMLARFVLEIPFHASLIIWPVSIVCGMLVVMFAGWLGTRKLAMQPALVILREA